MEILDIGGGFPAGEISPQLQKIMMDTYNDPLGYKVMAEPGKYNRFQIK